MYLNIKFQNYIKTQSVCNVSDFMNKIEERSNTLILRSSNLIAYQTGAQANFFFKHDCMNSKYIYHLCRNLTPKVFWLFVPKVM